MAQLQRKRAELSGSTCVSSGRARLVIELDWNTIEGLLMMTAELRAEGFRDVTPAKLAADMVASVVEDDVAAHADADSARH